MALIINTTNFADFVANSTINFRRAYDSFPKRAAQVYDIQGTDLVTGTESSLDGFTVAKIKREGSDFAYLDIAQGDSKTWTVYEVGGMTKITWLMRKGNKYSEMNKRINNLGASAAKRMEWDLTHRLTEADATSYTNIDGDTVSTVVGNGQTLADTDHAVTNSSTTYRNRVANNPVLSKGGLEAAEKLFATQMIDANGELIVSEPDTIITSSDPNTVNTALEYLRSVSAPDAGVSGVENVYKGKYKLLVLPYLATTPSTGAYNSSDAKFWFLADLKNTDAVCRILSNPTFIPPTENDGKESETMDWKFACHAAYAIEILRASWLVFSSGDGTA